MKKRNSSFIPGSRVFIARSLTFLQFLMSLLAHVYILTHAKTQECASFWLAFKYHTN